MHCCFLQLLRLRTLRNLIPLLSFILAVAADVLLLSPSIITPVSSPLSDEILKCEVTWHLSSLWLDDARNIVKPPHTTLF